jgi:choline dehydrogenase-like flavoprotein
VNFDAIVVGSGAGGSAAAWQLSRRGLRVLLLERGPRLPRDAGSHDAGRFPAGAAATVEGEPWSAPGGRTLLPRERFNLGGKTKWYGAGLVRFAPHEFAADLAHDCPCWPISYADMEPYYELAEHLLGAREFPVEPDLARIARGLEARDPAWTAQPMPLGLPGEILDRPDEPGGTDAFAAPHALTADAEVRLLDPVSSGSGLTVVTDKRVTDLVSGPDPTRIAGVRCADGTGYSANTVLLAAGALHSPRLLQRYVRATGLALRLPCSDAIGRAYKAHLSTAMLAVSWRRQTDFLRKTALLLHADHPHSSAVPLGWLDGAPLAPELPFFLPPALARLVGRHAYGLYLQTEDGSHRDNRVYDAPLADRPPIVDYDAARLPAAVSEHAAFTRRLADDLRHLGYAVLTRRVPVEDTTHACGTLPAGANPATSVVDADGRVHGLENAYVVDGSALPRLARVDPALTIYAWSLRVTSRLDIRTDRRARGALDRPHEGS